MPRADDSNFGELLFGKFLDKTIFWFVLRLGIFYNAGNRNLTRNPAVEVVFLIDKRFNFLAKGKGRRHRGVLGHGRGKLDTHSKRQRKATDRNQMKTHQ